MRIFLGFCLCAVTCFGQLQGIVDIHVHSDPDFTPRKQDALDIARLAQAEGMRGIVLKNHYAPTAQAAYLVNKAVPGIQTFGAIVLNRAVGGMNAEAIRQAVAVRGGNFRFVWMPTYDAENDAKFRHKDIPVVRLTSHGQLRPEVIEVLKVIAEHDLVLATGHISGAESLQVLKEARGLGIKRMIVTHPTVNVVNMSKAEMQEAVKLGAMLEFCANQSLPTALPDNSVLLEEYVKVIREVGVEHSILAGDLGQPHHPANAEGWKQFLTALSKLGITDAEIDVMARKNPAALLGLK